MKRAILAALALLLAPLAAVNAVQVGEELKDAGTYVDLYGGLRLRLTVEENNVVAHFVDADGKAVEPPAGSILLAVDDPGNKNDEWRVVLKPGADARLTSPRLLYAPYTFTAQVIIRYKERAPQTISNVKLELDRNSP